MRNKILLTLASVLAAGSMLAQDFTYQGINYTVLDATAKTVTTKVGTDNNHGHHDLAGSIVIPETVYDESNNAYTVTQIGNYSLTNNTEITELKLPKTLTTIGQFGLYGCGMEVLILPKSLESISYGGLSSCNNLTTLVIEGSPLFYVFSVNGTYNISSIYCLSDTPPTFQAGVGGAFSNTNATVYVSAENLSTYQNDAEWKKFANIEVGSYDIPTEPEEPSAGNVFTVVTDISQIGDEAEVVFANISATEAMGTELYIQASGAAQGFKATSNITDNGNGTITVGDDVALVKMTCKDSAKGVYTFEVLSGPNQGFIVGSTAASYPPMTLSPTESGATQFTLDTRKLTDGSTSFVFNYPRTVALNSSFYYDDGKNTFQLTTSKIQNTQSYAVKTIRLYVRGGEAPEEPEEPIEPEQPAGNDFTLVTDVSQFGDEAEIIILDSQDALAMGKDYYRKSTSAQYDRTSVTDFEINSDGTVTPGEEVCIATITKKDNGYVIFAPIATNPAMGYLNLNTVIDTYDREDQASVLTITIDENTGVAIVTDGKYYLGAFINDIIQPYFRSNNSSDEIGAHRNLKFYMRGSSAVEPEQPEEPETLDVPASIFMNVDEVHDLSVYLTDDAEIQTLAVSNVDWSSSNPEVTSVTADGSATGAGYGAAVVTAKDGAKTLLSVNTYVGTTLTVVYPDGSKVAHHVPYNAVANITITPSARWQITSASHDGEDVTAAVKDGKYVSAQPLTANSTITLVANEAEEPTTGAEELESARDIRILVNGRTLTVVGADDTETVGVYDIKGMTVYQGLSKTVTVANGGVYVVRVGEKVYKLAIL